MSSWYRTYRPTTIAGLHLVKVRQLFQKYLEQGTLPQVLLFAGSKGTGKTSTARILAAIINDPANAKAVTEQFLKTAVVKKRQPFHEPDLTNELVKRIQAGSSLAVHELDAASHRGIDDVRLLKEQVAVPPAEGQVAVFILDEVHMLTTEAFNALLKLLEEPPAHVLFVLATTELHKLPATVVSRCTVVTFTKAEPEELVAALETIATQEKIAFEPEALQAIADRADGSFRDAVKLAETLYHQHGTLKAADVAESSSGTVADSCQQLVQAVVAKDEVAVTQLFGRWRQQGVAVGFVEKTLCQVLHTALLQDMQVIPGEPFVSAKVAHFLLTEFLKVIPEQASPIPLLPLELQALDIVFRARQKKDGPSSGGGQSREVPSHHSGGIASTSVTAIPVKEMAPPAIEVEARVSPVADVVESEQLIPNILSDNLIAPDPELSGKLLANWQNFIAGVKQRNSSLAAILGSAKPRLSANGQACIEVYYRFHQEQLQQPKFMQMLRETMTEVVGGAVGLEFVVATLSEATSSTSLATQPALATDTIPADQLATLAVEALI